MNLTREKEAVSAYLKLLQTKGAASGMLYKRSLFLDQLCENLADKSLNSTEYGKALVIAIKKMPSDQYHINLSAAREFYPFWMKDLKAITTFNLHYGFDIDTSQWKPLSTSLKSLTDDLKTEKFDTAESWALKAYALTLRNGGADKLVLETRTNFAKIILIRLRDAPVKDHKSYRTVVDMTLPLFNNNDVRHLFLAVVREFYHFWAGNPDAASMVFKKGLDSL